MRDLSVERGHAQRTYSGDWATVTDQEQRRQALLRRLSTPQGALWYDRQYGNPAYARLSEPATTAWLERVAADCRQTALQEPGVQVGEVTVQRQDRQTVVRLTVIWGDGAAETIQTSL